MNERRNVKEFITTTFKVASLIFAFTLFFAGAIICFGSFFFEETRSQIQLVHLARNLALFIGGCALISSGVILFKKTGVFQ